MDSFSEPDRSVCFWFPPEEINQFRRILKSLKERERSVSFVVTQKEHNSWNNNMNKRLKLFSFKKIREEPWKSLITSLPFKKNHFNVLCWMDPARYILSEAELRDRKSQKVTQSSPTYGEASDLVSVLGFLDLLFSFTQPISKYIPVGEC